MESRGRSVSDQRPLSAWGSRSRRVPAASKGEAEQEAADQDCHHQKGDVEDQDEIEGHVRGSIATRPHGPEAYVNPDPEIGAAPIDLTGWAQPIERWRRARAGAAL